MNLLIQIIYLIASVLFILGIKMLSKPNTARRGNLYSAIGMLLAIVATLVQVELLSYTEIGICILIGGTIGAYYARTVEMTAMPEMVALFNGFGGLASAFVSFSDYWINQFEKNVPLDVLGGSVMVAGLIVGAITFTGSYVAFGKLKGIMYSGAVVFKGQHLLNLLLAFTALALSVVFIFQPDNYFLLIAIAVLAFLLGVLTVIPIGGADMPVVISLLNSYSGIAACLTGFILNNYVLIITGSLVGASGIILTDIMCKAMNRSLINVLLGGFGQTSSGAISSGRQEMTVKSVGVEEAAMIFDSASSIIIIPGYGMAVAQAQHIIREFYELLEKRGITVKFAIHPVAGRMPGHMNVLLAEANVPYDKLIEMDQINDEFGNTDIALVIGANDVVNPAARHDKQSPIYGMPILNADKARTVIISKRSMGKGYAGIENELFGYPNALMLFGDAKATFAKVVNELKEMTTV